jgi:hypothetical protein
MQLKINHYNDVILEWIPYNKLIEIKEKDGEVGFATAIWKDGPLYYNVRKYKSKYKRKSYEKVLLKYLNNSQNIDNTTMNEV